MTAEKTLEQEVESLARCMAMLTTFLQDGCSLIIIQFLLEQVVSSAMPILARDEDTIVINPCIIEKPNLTPDISDINDTEEYDE